jgi:hypothetical protein
MGLELSLQEGLLLNAEGARTRLQTTLDCFAKTDRFGESLLGIINRLTQPKNLVLGKTNLLFHVADIDLV